MCRSTEDGIPHRVTWNQESVSGFNIVNEGPLQSPDASQQLFWRPVIELTKTYLTVRIHNVVCVSVYVFNDLHTGYYFIVASSRERKKQDSTIEAVYI